MPPEAPPMKTVLPEGSEGSTAMPPMRPELPLPLFDAGPTEVQVVLASGLAGAVVKMRNAAAARSAAGSPRPLPGTGRCNVSDQRLSVPLRVPEALVISSRYRPAAARPIRLLSEIRVD